MRTYYVVTVLLALFLLAVASLSGCASGKTEAEKAQRGPAKVESKEVTKEPPAAPPEKANENVTEEKVRQEEPQEALKPEPVAVDPAKEGPWELKVAFKKGETRKYSLKSDVSIKIDMGQGQQMPPQQQSDEQTVTIKALEASAKGAKLEYKMVPKREKKEGAPPPTETNVTLEVTPKGMAKVVGDNKNMETGMLAAIPIAIIHCPDKPVKINDKWRVKVPNPLKQAPQFAQIGANISDTIDFNYKLVGATPKGLKVHATSQNKFSIDIKEGSPGGSGHADITMSFSADYVVDPKTAQVVSGSLTSKVQSKGEQKMGETTMKVSSEVNSKQTITRIK